MPQMDWEVFQEAHYRPHLVIANLAEMADPRQCETSVLMLARLGEALSGGGSYAVKRGKNDIRAAFEIDVDAKKFAAAVMARTAASPKWAALSSFPDRVAQERVSTALKRLRLKTAGGGKTSNAIR